jgi:pimeloyl-ACP methyl ester carboxylesterase
VKIFEVLVLVISIFLIIRTRFGKSMIRSTMISLTLLTIISVVLHLTINGYRWQMIPAYALTLYSIFRLLRHGRHAGLSFTRTKQRSIKRAISSSLVAVFIIIAIALPTLLPVFGFDSPNGPYAVGTVEYAMVDPNRQETYTEDPNDHREVLVQIWYPADIAKPLQGKAPYVKNVPVIAAEVKTKLQIPKFLFQYLELVKTNSYPNVSVASKQQSYPLILFSHGLPGARFSNTFQFEELASQGFIVASIEHTYNALATVLPDGKFVTIASLPGMTDIEAWDSLISDIWVKDSTFVLDELEKLSNKDANNLFSGKIDLDHVGMFGHSFGGANAVQVLYSDPRVKAAINMDGTMFGNMHKAEGTGKPFMLMDTKPFEIEANPVAPTESQLQELSMTRKQFDRMSIELPMRMKQALGTGAYELTLQRTRHMSFSDYYFWSPALPIMEKMPLSPRRAHKVINAYTVAFFQKHLQGLDTPLLDAEQSTDYPEAALKRY